METRCSATTPHPPQILPPRKCQEEVFRLLQKYPLPVVVVDKNTNKTGRQQQEQPMYFSYGTAGFRYDASLLDGTMVRVGILAVLRSVMVRGKDVGVMVTASHNDESYNGVKVADPNGGMMASDGEVLAVQLANAPLDELRTILNDYFSSSNNNINDTSTTDSEAPPPMIVVHVGRDTRCHSPHLATLTIQTIQAMGGTVVNHGVCTTPMLHHVVLHANASHYLPLLIPTRPNAEGYYDLIAHSYCNLLMTQTATDDVVVRRRQDEEALTLVVDCACGVGYGPLLRLIDKIQQLLPPPSSSSSSYSGAVGCRRTTKIVACNAPHDGPLNDGCGSEHVQKEVSPPKWYSSSSIDDDVNDASPSHPPTYAASLDGDADRIVFFAESPSFCLLDGDKIAVLICLFLQEQVDLLQSAIGVSANNNNPPLRPPPPLKLGAVQTAYANGASTNYLRSVVDNVLIAKTGVKHVHAAAHDNFDVAIYFEANGHGTVLFGPAFYDTLTYAHRVLLSSPHGGRSSGSNAVAALRRLCALPSLVNQAVGDALSDLLLVDAILQVKGWDIQRWNQLYTDLPSRQCKVMVQDRSIIETNENETRVTRPAELQIALDQAMVDILGRCFVRPSGTENVVRVYAEAKTSRDADALASKAAQLVHDLCNGVGTVPSFPSSNL